MFRLTMEVIPLIWLISAILVTGAGGFVLGFIRGSDLFADRNRLWLCRLGRHCWYHGGYWDKRRCLRCGAKQYFDEIGFGGPWVWQMVPDWRETTLMGEDVGP